MGNEGGRSDAPTQGFLSDVLRHANAFRPVLGACACLAIFIGGVVAFANTAEENVPYRVNHPVVIKPLTTTPTPETSPAPPS